MFTMTSMYLNAKNLGEKLSWQNICKRFDKKLKESKFEY